MTKRLDAVDQYIASHPPDVRRVLRQVRQTIRQAVPAAEEVISYGMPAYKLHGIVVYLAAHTNHIGLYPPPSSGSEALNRVMAKYRAGKGTLRFPFDRPIPFGLIRRVVVARARENLTKEKERLAKRRSRASRLGTAKRGD